MVILIGIDVLFSVLVLWPTFLLRLGGNPMREFLHVDDMAQASIFVMNLDSEIY